MRDLTVTGVQTCALPILLQAYPDCPPHFAFELQRMEHVNRSARLSSVVVALELSPSAVQAQMRSEERRVGKSVDLGGRRIIKKKKKNRIVRTSNTKQTAY